jgi:hypothetical protein
LPGALGKGLLGDRLADPAVAIFEGMDGFKMHVREARARQRR